MIPEYKIDDNKEPIDLIIDFCTYLSSHYECKLPEIYPMFGKEIKFIRTLYKNKSKKEILSIVITSCLNLINKKIPSDNDLMEQTEYFSSLQPKQ